MPAFQPTPSCARCGTCCRKGGPALHAQDRDLVAQGLIHTRHLFTIRPGEVVDDQIRGVLSALDGDLIKIKGRGGTWACCQFDEARSACRIYAHRPLECRALACRDTSGIEAAYGEPRLTRRDLLSGIEGLWELIEEHQRRCDHGLIRRLLEDSGPAGADAQRRALAEMIRYDEELRRMVVARGGLETGMTDFLFGRPLRQSLGGLRRHAPGAAGGAAPIT
jgi:Fe-S-cluster containining protein